LRFNDLHAIQNIFTTKFIILLIKNSPLNNFKALHKRNQKIDPVARNSWLTKKRVEKNVKIKKKYYDS